MSTDEEQYEDNTILILDQTISSKSLQSKISDLSFKQKIESIVFKLFEDGDEEFYMDRVRDKRFMIDLNLKYDFYLKDYWDEDSDRTYWLEVILKDYPSVDDLPHELCQDREFILQVLKFGKPEHERILYSLEDSRPDCAISEDREYALRLVKANGRALFYIENASNDREIVLEAVKSNGLVLDFAKEFQNDREIVKIAVTQNGLALEYASITLQKDREIVLYAVRQNGLALEFANKKYRNEREVVLEAVSQNGLALQFVSETLRNDYSCVMKALNGKEIEFFDLNYVGPYLRQRKDIVLKAVQADGPNLEKTSTKFKNDKEIVLEAVIQNGCSLQFASKVLKQDREIVIQAVKSNGYALGYASNELLNNREFVLEMVKISDGTLDNVKPEVCADKEIILAAVDCFPESIRFASPELQSDKDIVKRAIKSESSRMKQLDLLEVLAKFQRNELLIFQHCFFIDMEIFTYFKEEYSFVAPLDHPFWGSIMNGIEIYE